MAAYLGLVSRRLTSLTLAIAFVVTSVVGWANPVQAQAGLAPFQPLTQLNVINQPALATPPALTPYADPCDAVTFPGCAGASTTLSYGAGSDRVLATFEVASVPAPLERDRGIREGIVFRRNGPIARNVLFYESSSVTGGPPPTAISLTPGRAGDIPGALLGPIINRGIDNVFNNAQELSQDTRNDLQRIDYILPDGVVVPPEFQGQEGFLILERVGGIGDTVGIAAITALDAAGNPTDYGPLVRVPPVLANWGRGPVGQRITFPSVVLRDNPTVPELRPSHTVPAQDVGGIFFPINSLLPSPQSNNTVFGYSIVAGDVTAAGGTELVDFTNTAVFPLTTTQESNSGGLDLVAGGFGFFRAPRPPDPPLPPDPPPTPGNLFLNKRITQLITGGTVNPLNGIENPGDNAGFPALVTAGLGQGSINVADPRLQPGDEIEYSLYFNNTGGTEVTNVQVCDQIPLGTSFSPDGYGPGQGMLAIAPTAPAVPPATYTLVPYTNAGGDDPGTQLLPGATLPAVCGTPNLGNGAVAINVGTVGAGQVGLVRFKTRVNPPLPVTTPAP